MKKDNKASISIKKILLISIVLIIIMKVGVMAVGTKLNSVKIICSDGSEVDVITSKNKISEILSENHIIVLPNEKIEPGDNDEISDNKTIKIVKDDIVIANSKNEEITLENTLEDYDTVSEKIVKEQVSIPYETEVKDESTENAEKEEVVIQNGVEGSKEILYKVKYVEGNEQEKIEIAQNVIEEPTNCIKEIKNKRIASVTSRGSSSIETKSDESTSQNETEQSGDYSWSGKVLSRSSGVVNASETPSGYRETYYNLNMSGCLSIMGYSSDGYAVRSDGVKTYNGYVMVASPNLSRYPKGSYIPTTLGMGIVVDYCPGGSLDIAVTW